jgi:hypothetical protein
MSKHGPRYTTAFDTSTTDNIRSQINNLARNHNKLIRNSFEIDIVDWRNAVLPPEVREHALVAERLYHGMIYDAAYSGSFAMTHGALYASWEQHPDRFPRPTSVSTAKLFTDAAEPFVRRMEAFVEEWQSSAVDYGLVLDVFDWLNGKTSGFNEGFCAKGDRRHLRSLLPGVVPLIGKFDRDLAATLSAPMTGGKRPPVPVEHMEGIVRANQIIAAAMLLPPAPPMEHHISLALQTSRVTYAGAEWPRRFDTIPSL